jgi:glycosyltransferase involved in cell wall biosynthesis
MLDWLPIDSYPAGLTNIDIGCCPLSDTGFNRAKTYIKAMEYAASGAAVVASPTVYNQIIQHEYDGYIAETVDDWIEYLSRLVKSVNHRRQVARRLLAKVKRAHTLEQNAWRWLEAWTDLTSQWQGKQVRPEGIYYGNRIQQPA